MANLMVFVEVRAGVITPPSLHAVGEARRVADEVGATVYALLALPPTAAEALGALASELGRAGADRVLCCADPALEGPPLDALVGPVLRSVAERLRPAVTLFPAGAVGSELAPPLAARTGAALHPRATLECVSETEGGGRRLLIRRVRPDGSERVLDVARLQRPVVTTLGTGPVARPFFPTREIDELALPGPGQTGLQVLEAATDPDGSADLADALVLLGEGSDHAAGSALATALPGAVVLGVSGAVRAQDGCPARLLVIGQAPPGLRPAPSTRLGVAGPKGSEAALPRVDVVWRTSAAEAALALAALPPEEGV